jgi:SAM-dependent methyltransferase
MTSRRPSKWPMIRSLKNLLRPVRDAWRRGVHGEQINRATLARQYLAGDGLEIGALHCPLPVPRNARVRYIDRMPVDQLRQQYPELAETPLVPLDVIDDGERLATIGAASQDFVIANHFLEHTQDPIGTIGNVMRVLKPGGVFYMAVPDKRSTFDCERPVTPIDHVVRDHEDGPAASREAHYDEWVRLVYGRDGEAAVAETQRLMEMDYSIHFHVWDATAFLDLLNVAQARVGFHVELCMQNGIEIIAILRKAGGADEDARRRWAEQGLALVRGR